ncbi:rhomboid family intramembrane serine protease [Gloeobacter violaceus]|uniref:Gll4263 protein n=1 Tax=Gloeobacter violaceus (strain ATCC 29082 / PCC 7421) TaxID=251221 RepID=Q7NDH2_GLOVI|nr:rhomboid family intramembrane serine protease [Gloeobacter violaceus]BAC92204.1 gll4263 [Gloeobacter violaceus PCC 7421]
MVPLWDENRGYRIPWVNYGLIVTCIAVFIYEISLGEKQLEIFINQYAAVPAVIVPALGAIFQGDLGAVGLLAPLVTAMFLHGGILHLAGNMLYLWIFGDNVEERMGHFGYLAFYLICGVVSILAQTFLESGSKIASLGASGAIAGVLGAYIVMFPRAPVQGIFPLGFIPIPFKLPAVWFIGIWFLQQFLSTLATVNTSNVPDMEEGGVAYFAHAAGFVAGLVLVRVFARETDPYKRR